MARERKVFGSHSTLAHVWAQQNVAEGKASDGRMFFKGASIYSYGYHYVIARFVEHDGKKCVLFNAKGYSVSTGKHRSHVRGALHGLDVPVFTVENPQRDPGESDIRDMQTALNESAKSFARSTPYNFDASVAPFTGTVATINMIAEFFGLETRATAPVIPPEVMEKIAARVAKKQAREAAKAEARRLARAAADIKTRADYIAGGRHYLRNQEWGVAATFTAEDHAAHDIGYTEIQRDRVAAWRAGKPVDFSGLNAQISLYTGMSELTATMLRLNGDVIETSRGAEFPASHGAKAFAFIAECRAKGQGWEKNGHSIPLGTFTIDKIDADGTVHAGCHTVAWSEIEAIAKQMGLIA